MGSELTFSVMRVDASGELVLEYVREPHFGVSDGYVRDLFDDQEAATWFGEVIQGVERRWYRRTSMKACVEESRNPMRSDCFEPSRVRADVETIQARLVDMEGRLPRYYQFQLSTRVGEWRTDAQVFHGGKLFRVGGGWDRCRAWWWAERSGMDQIMALLYDAPDIVHDLTRLRTFRCIEAVRSPEGPQPGGPMVLRISSQSAAEYFQPFLQPIVDFCRAAEEGGFVVFTSHV